MSEDRDDRPAEGLVPLARAARDPAASPEDRLLAAALGAIYPVPPPPPGGWEELAGLAQRSAERRRRRYHLRESLRGLWPRPRWALVACGAALLGLCVICAVWRLRPAGRGAPQLARIEAPRSLLPSASSAAEAPRRQLLDGAEVELRDGSAEVEQAEPARTRLTLPWGRLRVRVPHLAEGARLTVATPDAEVIVHGTRFEVDRTTPDVTAVSVEEGLVEVRPAGGRRAPLFLRAGERAAVPGATRYRADLAGRVRALLQASRCDDGQQTLRTYLEEDEGGADASAALYLLGYCAMQRDDLDRAIGYFERVAGAQELLRADNALARAAQMLSLRGRAEGAAAWRRYLRRFPHGAHAALARRALAERR